MPTFHISDVLAAVEHHGQHGVHVGLVFLSQRCSGRFQWHSVAKMSCYKYGLLSLEHDSCSHAAVLADVAAGEDVDPAMKSANDASMAEVCYYVDYSGHYYAAELDDVEYVADYYYWSVVDDVADDNADYDCYSVDVIVAAETVVVVVVVADTDVAWCSRPFETDVLG